MISIDDKIDQFEAKMLELGEIAHFPLTHFFLPGLYVRTILMEKDRWITSMQHNTVHPFFIRKGSVSVYNPLTGEEQFGTGYFGITTPGTRRIIFTHEDTEWTTVHPLPFITGLENDLEDDEKLKLVEQIENFILEEHLNPLIGGVIKNNIITHKINQ